MPLKVIEFITYSVTCEELCIYYGIYNFIGFFLSKYIIIHNMQGNFKHNTELIINYSALEI